MIVLRRSGTAHCEPFEIHQTEFDRRSGRTHWSSCKTEAAPYDLAVKVCLIVLKHHLPSAIAVTSDQDDTAWAKAREVCLTSLGYGADFRLDRP